MPDDVVAKTRARLLAEEIEAFAARVERLNIARRRITSLYGRAVRFEITKFGELSATVE